MAKLSQMMRPAVVLSILVVIALLAFVLISYNKKASLASADHFFADGDKVLDVTSGYIPGNNEGPVMQAIPQGTSVAAKAPATPGVAAGEGFGLAPSDPQASGYNSVGNVVDKFEDASCFAKDRLTAEDLLPKDAANSKWAQMNPAGQGDVRDQNFLTAGHHIGINSIGSSKKNANLQLRSDPIAPQVVVSPWLQSTIEPDLMRKPFEIGA